MKTARNLIAALAVLVIGAFDTRAEIIDSTNWADEVVEWDGRVQNYGLHGPPELMDEDTTWWLLGAPDADVDGNGEAFDSCDQDSVAGWRNCGATDIEWFILRYDTAITDGEGDDLRVVTYGGPYGQAAVYASSDGEDFILLDHIGAGTPGILMDCWLDFDGQIDDVYFVKILRTATGPQTGRFFDAVGGVVHSSPPRIPGDADIDGDVDAADARRLAENWGYTTLNPNYETFWEMGDFNGDKVVGPADASILAANWGYGTEETSAVPEPTALVMLVSMALTVLPRRFTS